MACAPAARSRKSSPSQWSISCCSARASKASASISTSSPVPGSWPRTTTRLGALHVTGEVGDRHAALARLLVAAAGDDLGVAEHEGAVVVAGLGVLGDVDAEHLGAHADLRRGEPDAARRDPHGGDAGRRPAGRRRARSGRPSRRPSDSTAAGRGRPRAAPGHAEVGLGPLQDPGVEAHPGALTARRPRRRAA